MDEEELDVDMYIVNLKEAIQQQTDFLPKAVDQSRLKTDDIFTNLTVYHGRNFQQTEEAQEGRHARTANRIVKKCSDIFVAEDEGGCNPKSILVSGKPGIGKTLFAFKVLRDWSTSILLPQVTFAYLLTFRQLVLVADKKLTLRELLNLSPLLNEKSMIADEAMMESIIQNQEQLFIVLDGYDEFKNRSILHGKFESQFANDVKKEMPGKALLSKIIKKKILKDSIIMVTSRTGQANELEKKVHFDKLVEITEFSESQVLEYVEKYFSSKPEEVKKMAVDKIRGVAHYMSFGQVPLRCLWICQTIDLEIENNLTKVNPVPLTLTQLYSEIIFTLERNNREIRNLDEEAASLAVEKTLNNLAEVAAVLDEQNLFTFTLEDLKKLKMSEKEIAFLKSSSLIVCYPDTSNFPLRKTTLEYGFAHLTIQEFFIAWRFMKMVVMAARETNRFKRFMSKKPLSCIKNPSKMVYTFISGLLGQDEKNHDDTMKELLNCVSKQVENKWRRGIVLVRCLYEYGQEKELTRKVLTKKLDYKYWDKDGVIKLWDVTNSDCDGIGMLIDKSSAASQLHTLDVAFSSLSCSGLNSFLPALTKPDCTITTLHLWDCQLDDKCVQCLIQYIPNTKISKLGLMYNKITDFGVQYIIDHVTPQLWLWLDGNPVSQGCKKRAEQFFIEQEAVRIPPEIVVQGDHAKESYQRALDFGKVEVYRACVMIVGQDRAGKTSLKRSLLGRKFVRDLPSTVGVEVMPCTATHDEIKNWQTTESKPVIDNNGIASFIAKDMDKQETYSMTNILEDTEEDSMVSNPSQTPADDVSPSDERIKVIEEIASAKVILPKSDVHEQEVNKEPSNLPESIQSTESTKSKEREHHHMPEDIRASLIAHLKEKEIGETIKAKEYTINIWDFAGQQLYYASHPVFMSHRAVYILVYNLEKDLCAKAEPRVRQGTFDVILDNASNETNLDNLLSWLVSIHCLSQPMTDNSNETEGQPEYKRPPVIIVGTHADGSTEGKTRVETMEKEIKIAIRCCEFQDHVLSPYFAVNNENSSDDAGVQSLRSKISEVFKH